MTGSDYALDKGCLGRRLGSRLVGYTMTVGVVHAVAIVVGGVEAGKMR